MNERRKETRAERHANKREYITQYNIIPVCINFIHEVNVAFIMRSAACFGAKEVAVIGSVPDYRLLKALSGSTNLDMNIRKFSNPHDFLEHAKSQDAVVVSAELTEGSVSIYDYTFPKDKLVYLMCGHEQFGVPNEIIAHSDAVVHIPMPGPGFCLNTSQCATTLMFEYIRQMNV